MTVGDGCAFTARKIAYCAVMTALLIGAQFVLSFVSGVEIVTLLLACFSASAGIICGVVTAVAFSLLRCFIWGFYPNVIALYLIYYPAFALIFGLMSKIREQSFTRGGAGIFVAVNAMLISVATTSFVFSAFKLIKISRLYSATAYALAWAIFGLSAALLICFNAMFAYVRIKGRGGYILKIFLFASAASICTICFTLLDDVLTPLFVGMTPATALGYFYASFIAMLTQTLCAILSISFLFIPVMRVMQRAFRR